MSRIETLRAAVQTALGERLSSVKTDLGEITAVVRPDDLLEVARTLRDAPELRFEQLIDLCGVDYSAYAGRASEGIDGLEEDSSSEASGVEGGGQSGESTLQPRAAPGESSVPPHGGSRYAVVYHLLSLTHNWRLRLRTFATDDEFPVLDSVLDVWPSANWYEREAFDLFGIVFTGHPDLRRILTDYGFVGHPFRKDFPVSGNVEMRYDPDQQRVIYQPVTIEPREITPRIVREENYAGSEREGVRGVGGVKE